MKSCQYLFVPLQVIFNMSIQREADQSFLSGSGTHTLVCIRVECLHDSRGHCGNVRRWYEKSRAAIVDLFGYAADRRRHDRCSTRKRFENCIWKRIDPRAVKV